MNWIYIVGGVAVWGSIVALLWRIVSGFTRMSSQSLTGARDIMRAADRERHDNQRLITTLIEKRDCSPMDAARLHVQERVAQAHADTHLERRAIDTGDSPRNRPVWRPPADEECTPEEAISEG